MQSESDSFLARGGLGPLRVWRDEQPRSAALNMAIDEVLLREMHESEGKVSILRYYEWLRPSVSIGYFQRWRETLQTGEFEAVDLIRRWTGGGKVDHRVDRTYTLVVSRDHAFYFLPPTENYRWVHQQVVKALRQVGRRALVTDTVDSFSPRGDHSPNCFDRPVQFDVVDDGGAKVAGAAQRRTRWGLLHQGSVVEEGLNEDNQNREDWETGLAGLLSGDDKNVIDWQPPAEWLQQAEDLAEEKYAPKSWLEKF